MPKKDRNDKRKEPVTIEPYLQVWAWILLTWSLYRYFFHLPEWADELLFKPLVFVLPVLRYVLKIEKKSLATLGLTWNNIFRSLYVGVGFGFMFGLEGIIVNYFKNGTISLTPINAVQIYGVLPLLFLSFATSFSEELLCRGFLFTRIREKTGRVYYAALISALLFVCLHVPILVTSNHLFGPLLVLFFATNIILGFINSIMFYQTGSLITPILIHAFWNMTVALYL